MILVELTYIKDGDVSTGIASVACNLLDYWHKKKRADIALYVSESSIEYFQDRYPDFTIIKESGHRRINIRKVQLITNRQVNVVFSPCINARSRVTNNVPMAGILHDVQKYSINRNFFLKFMIYKTLMRYVLCHYTKVVAITNAEKKNIESCLPYLRGKINVIYNSVKVHDPESYSNVKFEHYILNVNTLFPYKNALTLVKAFNAIKGYIPHGLVIKAKPTPYWNKDVLPYIKENELEDRIQIISEKLSDGQLAELYSKADLFVSPSTMEGFGLTPVEAVLYKTPVITSAIPALLESTLQLVNYYDNPYDYKKLSEEMLSTLQNDDKEKMQNIANTFSNAYSVEKQAEQYLDLLNKLSK